MIFQTWKIYNLNSKLFQDPYEPCTLLKQKLDIGLTQIDKNQENGTALRHYVTTTHHIC